MSPSFLPKSVWGRRLFPPPALPYLANLRNSLESVRVVRGSSPRGTRGSLRFPDARCTFVG
ncbi:MAG: hypothetical protein BLITH_0966 [Brockia lithotrophica]|uniref:Uncharacterized protein n=1 Tax=Brockia lithotrophica TaxID=933949 RepID=A0A2T5G746_9BACL|nr:MAG: hypothetical protein BLITH_0966 [Brockia lithotrophica]